MQDQHLVLSKPSVELGASYLDFIAEQRLLGERVWDSWVPAPSEGPAEFVARLTGAEASVVPPSVKTTTYWATVGGKVVARGALRHALTPELAEFGGHLSYEVRPAHRRRGIATEVIRQILQTDRAKAIGTLLVTCAPENVGSNRAILANGGQLVKTSFVQRLDRNTNYYRLLVPSGSGR